ncbi:hypothetical protein E2C01_005096 [Portunus trituberculatus]|uniref:Uncharacterized protein n=1 Tax=Portunus trituberculatus TaxID=210409 RepID=A0A5B7CT35_PORTR|nr:hypothetical protein [Portunus trituberculatus]
MHFFSQTSTYFLPAVPLSLLGHVKPPSPSDPSWSRLAPHGSATQVDPQCSADYEKWCCLACHGLESPLVLRRALNQHVVRSLGTRSQWLLKKCASQRPRSVMGITERRP